MAEKLSSEPGSRLAACLSTWRDWVSGPVEQPVVVKQLGGSSNFSFLVNTQDRYWVVRLHQTLADTGISLGADPASELSAMTIAAGTGIAPAVVFSTDTILVTEFVVGEVPSLADLPQIGQLFREIHELKAEVLSMDLTQHLLHYRRQVPHDPVIDACFDQIMALKIRMGKPVVCHQDLLFENMIKTPTRIFAIDWEYARLADPAYDLAVFTATYQLDDQQRLVLLNAYGGHDPELAVRILYFEKVYALVEIFWWQIKGRRMEEKINRLAQSLENER